MLSKKTIILLFVLSVISFAKAQETVAFLPENPIIDGVLDKHTLKSGIKKFQEIHKSNKDINDVEAKYYLGYNSEFLYIYIEAEADQIIYRDRGYQNGDGFHLTVARPNEDRSKTDEFYVLGFSPSDDRWNKMRWYYNVDLSMAILPDEVLFETAEQNGKISFELLLPWSVVKPYQPWINPNIGFNLCFVKAAKENDKIYHFITTDERMQSEQSKRKYVTLDFQKPTSEGEIFASPARFNFSKKQDIQIHFAGYFQNPNAKSLNIKVLNDQDDEIYFKQLKLKFAKGLSKITKTLSDFSPEAGNYHILIYDKNVLTATHYISVFENFDIDKMRKILGDNKAKIKPGTFNTMQFYMNDLEEEINKLKYYESSEIIPAKAAKIRNYISEIELQKDPLEIQTGTYRRAFLSKTDTSYRPYSVYVPTNYSAKKQYPLLVYLHGSGQDDRALFHTDFIKEGFIVLAPNGRGTSNCFATEEAQTDIKEAVDDVIANFNINTEKIILSGFSMGGYGVYRTYYEYTNMFSALAIFSGHPDLARKWRGGNEINFLDDEFAKIFSDIPIFLYHGKQDLNCPFGLAEQMVQKIRKVNNKLVFVTESQKGHGSMNEENRQRYFEWLKKQI